MDVASLAMVDDTRRGGCGRVVPIWRGGMKIEEYGGSVANVRGITPGYQAVEWKPDTIQMQ
jgi:hypothetical protein